MSIVDNLEDIASVVQQADNLDLYRKELDAEQEGVELIDENRCLRDEKRTLEEALSIKVIAVIRE